MMIRMPFAFTNSITHQHLLLMLYQTISEEINILPLTETIVFAIPDSVDLYTLLWVQTETFTNHSHNIRLFYWCKIKLFWRKSRKYPYFYNKNRSFKRKRQFYSNFLLWFAITVLIKKTNFNFLNLVESKFRPKMFMTSNVSYEGKKGS